MTLKEELELYNKTGMYIRPHHISQEYEKAYASAVTSFYYLEFYVNDALRDYKCLCSRDYYQTALYGDETRKTLIQYYQHHIVSLFTNVGFIKKLIDQVNQKHYTQNIIVGNVDDYPRHKIHHFIPDIPKLRKNLGVIHGLNVVFDESDTHLRNVNGMNRLLDLIEMKYFYIDEKNLRHEVSLHDLGNRLQAIARTVTNVQTFIYSNILTEAD